MKYGKYLKFLSMIIAIFAQFNLCIGMNKGPALNRIYGLCKRLLKSGKADLPTECPPVSDLETAARDISSHPLSDEDFGSFSDDAESKSFPLFGEKDLTYNGRLIRDLNPKESIIIQRRSEEDRMKTVILDDGRVPVRVYAIFDGHGGSAVVDYIFENIAKLLALNLPSYNPQDRKLTRREREETVESLRNLMIELDTDICKNGIINAGYSGTTVAMALIIKQSIVVVTLGDSRIYIKPSVGQTFVTHDHSPSDVNELKRINEAGGFVVNIYGCLRVDGHLAVSRALGDCQLKFRSDHDSYSYDGHVSADPSIEIIDIPISRAKKSKLMIMSDGAHENFENFEILGFMERPLPAASLANEAIRMSPSKKYGDDISVIYEEI